MFDLHCFDQNILSFENSLIRKDLIRSWIFRYFSITFYIQLILSQVAQAHYESREQHYPT